MPLNVLGARLVFMPARNPINFLKKRKKRRNLPIRLTPW
jgi:hypothetical protein